METNDQFRVSSKKVLALYEAVRVEETLALHMVDEHAISHLLEPALRELVADASTETAENNTETGWRDGDVAGHHFGLRRPHLNASCYPCAPGTDAGTIRPSICLEDHAGPV